MDDNHDLITAVRDGSLQTVNEWINSSEFSTTKEWSGGYDLILTALKRNHKDVAKLLLSSGSNVNHDSEFSSTPLHYAVTYGNLEAIQMLLNRDAKINAKDPYGRTPLHYATVSNQTKIVNLLLNRGACVNTGDTYGITPLHIASKRNSVEIVKVLLHNGAHNNMGGYCTPKQHLDEKSLQEAAEIDSGKISKACFNNDIKSLRGTPLHIAAQEGHLNVVENLINYQADVNSLCILTGYTPLHHAAARGNSDIARLLLINGADVNAVAKKNVVPVYLATRKKHETTVKLLLEHGADINVQNENGKTVLYLAVEMGQISIFHCILDYLPDINNESNRNSLKRAMKSKNSLKYRTIVKHLLDYGFYINSTDIQERKLVRFAIQNGYVKIIADLLSYGADVNMKYKSEKESTPLHCAVTSKQVKIVKLLLCYKADVNPKDEIGKTPIFYSIQNDDWQITKLLLHSGAETKEDPDLLIFAIRKHWTKVVEFILRDYDIDVNAVDGSGRTALHYTVLDNWCDNEMGPYLVRLLLSRGAATEVRTKDGNTVLHAAVKKGYTEVVKALLEHHAQVNSVAEGDITPLHVATMNGNHEIVENLVYYGADVDAVDACGRSALHLATRGINRNLVRILLLNESNINLRSTESLRKYDLPCIDSLIRHPNYECYNLDTENSKIIIQHIAIMKAKTLYVNEKYLTTIENNPILKRKYDICEREINYMKNKNIDYTNLSYYDILTKTTHRLALFSKINLVIRYFKIKIVRKLFPIYADVLEYKILNTEERRNLLNSSIQSLNVLLGYELPYHITYEILSYLKNADLARLVDCLCISDST